MWPSVAKSGLPITARSKTTPWLGRRQESLPARLCAAGKLSGAHPHGRSINSRSNSPGLAACLSWQNGSRGSRAGAQQKANDGHESLKPKRLSSGLTRFAIPVDPHPKTEHNTNRDSRYWCLGTGLVHLTGAVRSIPSHIFSELRAYGLVYSEEPSPIKLHQRI